MWRATLCILMLFAFIAAAPTAIAQSSEPASIATIESEAGAMLDLDGPDPSTKRPVAIWRAPSSPPGPLPTLYMADGANGLYVIAARLRPLIEAGIVPPIQIIAIYPDLEHRADEYIERGRPRFRAHERWLLETVIPWAEASGFASPEHRVIGGYSNGGAFALFMASAHPDLFAGVLAHSPVATAETFRLAAGASHIRWALSAGRLEFGGYPLRAVSVVRGAANGQGADVRTCTGAWGHDPHIWAELSPGALAWLFDFPGADAAATPLEREACRVTPAR